ncbi:hypothetical protein ElyMa_002530300 [Elysia marginata]|uniref:Kinesin motor domain-containing protein n=1 Tax=Elysia marginata TaxID=1093978 RepID=A0AAV4GTT2_9GAST|nr:hypothetical protein ElyMa_002530300 [Elysia marginata]
MTDRACKNFNQPGGRVEVALRPSLMEDRACKKFNQSTGQSIDRVEATRRSAQLPLKSPTGPRWAGLGTTLPPHRAHKTTAVVVRLEQAANVSTGKRQLCRKKKSTTTEPPLLSRSL